MLFEKIQLEPKEKVLKMVRKHWFFILVELVGVLILLLFPFIVLLFLNLSVSNTFLENIDMGNYLAPVTSFVATWSLLVIMSAFTIWTHYYLDLWIITDRRIISVDQISFFSRNVSIFRLERLQDIEFNINGLIPTLLNFGTLKAQTAGAHESNFQSKGLPDPRSLQALIQQATDERIKVLEGGSTSLE